MGTGRARIGVADDVPDVLQRHAGPEQRGREETPETVRADLVGRWEADSVARGG